MTNEEAFEKTEKYKWHDLRKNPKDLPEYDEDEHFYDDRDEFEEDIEEWLADEVSANVPDDVFKQMVKAEMEKYEPFWVKCICVYASN